MYRIFIALITFLSLAAAANAQVPMGGNLFVGYSYLGGDFSSSGRTNLNGWDASLEGKIFPFVGMVADISADYGSERVLVGTCTGIIGQPCAATGSLNINMHNYLFGPRVSVSVARFRPFAEALFGFSRFHQSNSSFSSADTSFDTAFGGGIDYRLLGPAMWRIEGDALQTRLFGGTQNNFRISTGLVLHF